MNKEQYKRLLNLRKSEEVLLFEYLRICKEVGITPRKAIESLPINEKRAHYLLLKWTDKRIYEFGVCLDLGWFISDYK
jgi:hypothetical protein